MLFMVGLALTLPALAQHEALLAAAVPADGVVNLYRVNGTQLQLTKAVSVGKTLGQMCLDPTGSTLFVGKQDPMGASAIDLNSKAVVGTFSDAGLQAPDGCVVNPDGKKLYLIDRKANAVFVFATGTGRLMKKIVVAEEPRRGLFLPNGKLVVGSDGANSLNLIDPATDSVIRTIRAGPEGWNIDPRILALTPDGKFLVVAKVSADILVFYNPDTLELIVEYGMRRSPQALVMAPDAKTIYALSVAENLVAIVKDYNGKEWRAAATIPVGPPLPLSMAGDPKGAYLYVSRRDGTIVAVEIATQKVTTIPDVKGGGALIYRP
jgi:DNA-binding beta-propeller fold protein YncE